jgi:hypothetical protein
MLRLLYRLTLCAHPPCFRRRFAEEMQSIFDEADSGLAEAGLLADAILSLLRQWSLRPQFWEESPLAGAGPGQGTPIFSVLDKSKPRAAALVYGALLSALVLNGVCWTMGYAWNHPIFIELRRPVFVPPASWGRKSMSVPRDEATESAEPSLYTGEGRVVLIFPSHARPSGEADPAIQLSMSSREEPAPSSSGAPIFLQAYPGTYLSTAENGARVNVTLHSGRLQLEVVGFFSSPIVPVPGSQEMTCAVRNCFARFSTNASSVANEVEIHFDGRTIHAYRVQGAVF